jgi:hypothetical protein
MELARLPSSRKADLSRANRLQPDPEEEVIRCDGYTSAIAESHFLQQVRSLQRFESKTRLTRPRRWVSAVLPGHQQ